MKLKINVYNVLWDLKHLPATLVRIVRGVFSFFRFVILIFVVFIYFLLNRNSVDRMISKPKHKRFFLIDAISKIYSKIYVILLKILDTSKPQEMKSSDMILLAIKNLTSKKARSFVTVGGMAIGFGAVILLLSAGYGFERLVISEVANLSEMKQIDITISNGSPLVFDSEAMSSIKKIDHVSSVIPIITSVSKIAYNDAVSDVIVYAVPTEYFDEASIRPLDGELFSDSTKIITSELTVDETGEVAGVSTMLIGKQSYGAEIYKVRYGINPLVWKPVYESPDYHAQLIGYTKRQPGKQEAVEVWGSVYPDGASSALDIDGNSYNTWISDEFPLWNMGNCLLKEPDCVDGEYSVKRNGDGQSVESGFITEDMVVIERYNLSVGSSFELYDGKLIDDITYTVDANSLVDMYFETTKESKHSVLEGDKWAREFQGQLLLGSCTESETATCLESTDNRLYGYWVRTSLDVWGSAECGNLCEMYVLEPTDDYPERSNLTVYIPASELKFSDAVQDQFFSENDAVLGAETETEAGAEVETNIEDDNFIDLNTLIGSDDTIDWATISSELGTIEEVEKEVKEFPENAKKQAIVNTAMLSLLGIDVDEALGEKFNATLIFDSTLFDKDNYVVESESADFTIHGIVSDSSTPTFFVPFADVQVEGLKNVSSLKIITRTTEDVAEIRKNIEALGFQTSSVVDTVASISSFFDNLRIALLVLGLIALGVASLGMFNTLTVSLLEKTQEVGLLKTMGLKSGEVSTLFLAESMIMSVLGGVVGLFLGFAVGKLLGLLVSLLSISQGSGYLNVTYIPFSLGFSIIAMSAVVGVVTGWYPASRAKKISALNALRYE